MPEIRTLNQVEQSPVHIVSVSSDQVRPMQELQSVIIYTGGIPQGGEPGDLIAKKTDIDYDTEWVTPAAAVEQNNHNPVTSDAVYSGIQNAISELLNAGFIINGCDAAFVAGGD